MVIAPLPETTVFNDSKEFCCCYFHLRSSSSLPSVWIHLPYFWVFVDLCWLISLYVIMYPQQACRREVFVVSPTLTNAPSERPQAYFLVGLQKLFDSWNPEYETRAWPHGVQIITNVCLPVRQSSVALPRWVSAAYKRHIPNVGSFILLTITEQNKARASQVSTNLILFLFLT